MTINHFTMYLFCPNCLKLLLILLIRFFNMYRNYILNQMFNYKYDFISVLQ